MFFRTCFLALFSLTTALQAQHLSFSKGDWSIAHEGEEINFQITSTDSVPALRFYFEGEVLQGMKLDSTGHFS